MSLSPTVTPETQTQSRNSTVLWHTQLKTLLDAASCFPPAEWDPRGLSCSRPLAFLPAMLLSCTSLWGMKGRDHFLSLVTHT